MQALLVAHYLLYPRTDLPLQPLHLLRRLRQLVHLLQVVIFLAQLCSQLLRVRFDVLLGLVLAVVYLRDLFLQLLEESEGVAFGVLLAGAEGVADVVVVVGDVPDSVGGLQFVAFVGPGLEGSCLLG